jgi:hypothetical protein
MAQGMRRILLTCRQPVGSLTFRSLPAREKTPRGSCGEWHAMDTKMGRALLHGSVAHYAGCAGVTLWAPSFL